VVVLPPKKPPLERQGGYRRTGDVAEETSGGVDPTGRGTPTSVSNVEEALEASRFSLVRSL
jgi:hypothetical protein